MKPVFLFYLAACLLFAPKIHKFEDGFVERTMAVVVRGRTARVEYAIGLNETTLRQVLESWDDAPADSPAPVVSPETATQPGTGKTVDGIKSEQASEKNQSENENQSEYPLESRLQTADAIDTSTVDEPSGISDPSPEESKTTQEDESDHVIDASLLEKLHKSGPAEISKRVAVLCNGQPVTVTSATLGPTPRHPFTVVVRFEFQIPDSDICELKMDDSNFPGQAGAVRYSLKAIGNAAILQSDVAPIIVRAQRVEHSPLANNKRSLHTTVSARLAMLPQSEK